MTFPWVFDMAMPVIAFSQDFLSSPHLTPAWCPSGEWVLLICLVETVKTEFDHEMSTILGNQEFLDVVI